MVFIKVDEREGKKAIKGKMRERGKKTMKTPSKVACVGGGVFMACDLCMFERSAGQRVGLCLSPASLDCCC